MINNKKNKKSNKRQLSSSKRLRIDNNKSKITKMNISCESNFRSKA